ncbi:ABC transporter permease [Aquimarina rhabdastrellae]
MKAYFVLQFKILNRKLIAFGLPLLIGYPLLLVVFIGVSVYIFSRTPYAVYIYTALALISVLKLSAQDRNDFLNTIFNKKQYRIIREIENFGLVFPFVCFLTYKQEFLMLLPISVGAIIISFIKFNTGFYLTIPTPFGKRPFEFTRGFRKGYLVFPLAYFLTFMAITVDNFNLGVFAIGLITVVTLTFYSRPEDEYYVWSFRLSAKAFLMQKIKTGIRYLTGLNLPILIALSIFFYDQMIVIILFNLLCYVYLITIIVAKYADYPKEMNLPHMVLIIMSVLFPPILAGIIPWFYAKAIKKLNIYIQ